eukprot:12921264-Prorocentrum_lima.AAC.1
MLRLAESWTPKTQTREGQGGAHTQKAELWASRLVARVKQVKKQSEEQAKNLYGRMHREGAQCKPKEKDKA